MINNVKKFRTKLIAYTLCLYAVFFINGCALLTGTELWCEYMEERPKTDWSLSEATDYAKHCVIDD